MAILALEVEFFAYPVAFRHLLLARIDDLCFDNDEETESDNDDHAEGGPDVCVIPVQPMTLDDFRAVIPLKGLSCHFFLMLVQAAFLPAFYKVQCPKNL